ncbi:hypothetical protein IMSAG025_02243 [Muribaculaceae bacterium]|nr:hypothetical protein IMSAG025_02243 [Muribaculaceae bacterium]
MSDLAESFFRTHYPRLDSCRECGLDIGDTIFLALHGIRAVTGNLLYPLHCRSVSQTQRINEHRRHRRRRLAPPTRYLVKDSSVSLMTDAYSYRQRENRYRLCDLVLIESV